MSSSTVLNANWDKVDNGYETLSSQLITTREYSNYYRFEDPTTGISFGINPIVNRMFLMDGNGNTYYYTLTPMA